MTLKFSKKDNIRLIEKKKIINDNENPPSFGRSDVRLIWYKTRKKKYE